MSKEDEYSNAIQFRDREGKCPHGSSEVFLVIRHLLPGPAEVKLLLLEQLCDSGGVFTYSYVIPQVKPLMSPCGPALKTWS